MLSNRGVMYRESTCICSIVGNTSRGVTFGSSIPAYGCVLDRMTEFWHPARTNRPKTSKSRRGGSRYSQKTSSPSGE